MLVLNQLVCCIASNLNQEVGWGCWTPKHKEFVWLLNGQLEWLLEMSLGRSWFIIKSYKLLKIKWQSVRWIDKILLAPFFQLKVSFPLLSIQKAWQSVYNCLNQKIESLQHGFNFGVPSIWWNKLVQYQGQPLAVAFPRHAFQLFNKGIRWFGDLWDFNTLGYIIKNKFCLNVKLQSFVIFVRALVPMDLIIKLCTPLHCNAFKDSWWLKKVQFCYFPLKKIYFTMLPSQQLAPRLNEKWNCNFKEKTWRGLSAWVWRSKAKTNAQILPWKVLHSKLPVGDRLRCMMVQPIQCHFYQYKESLKHIFWDCSWTKGNGMLFLNFSLLFLSIS